MSTFEESLDQVTGLISLPEVYIKISKLMDDPLSDVDDFADVIKFDPNLTATVLKVVNSAFYGFSGQVDSIHRAVGMIGIGQLHIIALSISAISALDALNYPADIIPLKTFWRCSLFTGVLSRQLALQLQIRNSEHLFVTGLLHEIGHLVLYTHYPDLARQARQLTQDSNIPIHQAEQQITKCHYGQIGARLMAQWNLSKSFQMLTRYQPTPLLASEEKVETALLHIAHSYAYWQFLSPETDPGELIEAGAWEQAGISPETVDNTLPCAREISISMEKLLLK